MNERLAFFMQKWAEYVAARYRCIHVPGTRRQRLIAYKNALALSRAADRLSREYPIKIVPCRSTGERWKNWVTYERAIELISEGKAIVQSENIIVSIKRYQRVRYAVLERDNYTCHYCGGFGYTLDHVVPVSKGGKTKVSNGVCACGECNQAKGDMDYEDFILMIQRPVMHKLAIARQITNF